MVARCPHLLLILLAVGDQGCLGQGDQGEVIPDDVVVQPWWVSLLNMQDVQPRIARSSGKEDRFWATRGKRVLPDQQVWKTMFGKRRIAIKPNGLFQAIEAKRSLKPNGLFGLTTGKRNNLKPNSLFTLTAGKRSSYKPNSLFSMTSGKRNSLKPNSLFFLQSAKRSSLKPNGLFSTFKGKKAFNLKPNGLFSLAKRNMVMQSPSVDDERVPMFDYGPYYLGSYKSGTEFDDEPYHIEDDKDLHESSNDIEDEHMDEQEEDIYDDKLDEDNNLEKRGSTFWATRGKRSNGHFWATRGKKSEDTFE